MTELDGTAAVNLFGDLLAGQAREADVIVRVRHDEKHREAGEAFRVSHAVAGKETAGTGSTLTEAVESYIEALGAGA